MQLIRDLGMHNVCGKDYKKRYGLYECPVCHKHFECQVGSVKSGNTTKCKSCADKAMATDIVLKAASEFIEKAKATHGDLYEYPLVDYVNNKTKVKITCPVHGVFEQTPNNHLSGQGCPKCGIEKRDIALRMSENNDRPTTLYYVYFPEVNLWKVGCTTKTVEERFSREVLEYIVIKTKEYTSGNEAYRVEKVILDATKEFQFTGKVLSRGNTELRTQPIEYFNSIIPEGY